MELTKSQTEFLTLLIRGYSDCELSRELKIAKRTAQNWVRTLRRRFGAKNRAHLAVIVVTKGIVSL